MKPEEFSKGVKFSYEGEFVLAEKGKIQTVTSLIRGMVKTDLTTFGELSNYAAACKPKAKHSKNKE